MIQRELFRQTDPETSRLGAEHARTKLGKLQAEFCRRAIRWHSAYGRWPTAQEISGGDESIRKRAKELVRKGYVRIGEVRRCNITGKQAQTYEVKENL